MCNRVGTDRAEMEKAGMLPAGARCVAFYRATVSCAIAFFDQYGMPSSHGIGISSPRVQHETDHRRHSLSDSHRDLVISASTRNCFPDH